MQITKRDGQSEAFDIDKIHRVMNWAIDGLSGVNISDIEINAKINLRDGITTDEIHSVLVESAAGLITLDAPNYQYVAGRLLNYQLRKRVWGGKDAPALRDFVASRIVLGMYDPAIMEMYSEDDFAALDKVLDHDRDFLFVYSGIKTLCDKYLVQRRDTKQIFETPQFAYMLTAMVACSKYGEQRLHHVKEAYWAFSKHKISLATPIMAKCRTKTRQYASCCLVEVDDSMDSITASIAAIMDATAGGYGIGLDFSKMRAANAPIRNGEALHTGVIPFLKTFESAVKSCHQGGLRGGGGTVHFDIFHFEIEDILQLKNNGGTEDNRVRKLDYSIKLSRLFYERFKNNENITLFSPHEARELFDKHGDEDFEELYVKYERKTSLKFKKVVPARQLFGLLVKERIETARIYVLNIDHVNSHSSWISHIGMSNLCQEVTHPVAPVSLDEPEAGSIGVCVLSAINMLTVKNDEELTRVCNIVVRFLDDLIDYMEYFHPAAKNFATKERSLGIGVTNYAAWLAKLGWKASSPEARRDTHVFFEKLQYRLLRASNVLAMEKGHCTRHGFSKYARGILPIDTYKKEVDQIINVPLTEDWEGLRKDIESHGLRNNSLTAQMPVESSSVIQNTTNGIEFPLGFFVNKLSKKGSLPQIVPNYQRDRTGYTTRYEVTNKDINELCGIMQKFIDQAISVNHHYDYSRYAGGILPDTEVIKDIFGAYKYGNKSLYYANPLTKSLDVPVDDDCASGACKL